MEQLPSANIAGIPLFSTDKMHMADNLLLLL